jgi:putative transposase
VPLRGFKYRFYPTVEQEILLRRTIGCCRFVYNRALHERSEAWINGKKSIGYAVQSAALTGWKKEPELAFLNEVSSVPVQQTLRHLQTAYANFFAKRTKYPSFKRKHSGGSAEFTRSGFRFTDGKLILAKMDTPLDIRWSRPLPEGADPSSASVSLDAAQRWHVSLLCEDHAVKHLPKLKSAVGVDLGISALATLSTGEKIPNLRHDSREQRRKRRLSRSLNRKKKGSRNRYKARIKLARLYAKVADRRHDYIAKLSTRLVRENQVIAVEDLNVAGMVHNHCLARVISDAAWHLLLSFLAYKCAWYGRELIKVDRFYPSSKTCSVCGHVVEHLPLDVRHWTCPSCKAQHDRDENAARNLLAAGLAVSVSGPGVSQHVLRNVLQSGLKEKCSAVKSGIRLL